ISPSVLGANLMCLGEEIRRVEELGIGWLHLDHMDGHFVPNISFGPDFVSAMRKQTKLFLDVHLMLSEPMKYIETYAKAGADLITVHVEADDDAETMLRAIAAQGIKAGISIKPDTPVQAIEPLLPLCDLVLVMTVEPGFGGQSLREDCVAKIPELKAMIEKSGRDILIEVDGGVKRENAEKVVRAGADVLVMGTGLFRADDPKAVEREVLACAEA
ncbi:MAG: ribulose-phosphate 3-epimerase, partial [Christensenellales bacterium]|nr:ribulose-phosphate 3-epimerase [Christensenellales bacterium]